MRAYPGQGAADIADLLRPFTEAAVEGNVRVLREGSDADIPLFLFHAAGGSSGVADAVNETVVIAFITVFVVNTVLSQLYGAVVPSVGRY